MNDPRIGIVGAGPGGLVAARILSLQGKGVTVFERESSFSDRSQGGSLDIHAVAGVMPLQGGKCALNFADGTSDRFDVVVGADGTWSKVRPLLSAAIPEYTGILVMEFGIDNVEERYPDTAAMAGRGLTFALGDSKALIAHRNADAHLGGYIGLRVEENWFQTNGLDKLDDAVVRELLCAEFAGWSDDLLLWIRRSDGKVAPRGIYELPAGHRWEHHESVTLLGDAAHVISPFGGDGANLAMLDGADLAEALLQPDWRTAVAMFEESMCARAEGPARSTSETMQEVFSPRGLEHSLQWGYI